MYNFKLLGLVLSALLSVAPISPEGTTSGTDWTVFQFPQTRNVRVVWTTKVSVTDLGYSDDINWQGSVSGTIDVENTNHQYLFTYEHVIHATEPFLNYPAATQSWSCDQVFYTNLYDECTSSEMRDFLDYFSSVGSKAVDLTFASPDDIQSFQIQVPRANGVTYNMNLYFRGATPYFYEQNIARGAVNAASYLLWMRFHWGNIPSSVMQQYQQYIDNGDYSTAETYINNYYQSQIENDNNTTNNTLNTYNTKNTNLNTVFTTENNFTNQVETDFQTQQQALPNVNQSIEDLQGTSFLQSANWVTRQFNNLTVGNAFGQILTFSLFAGFILALIGRFKR